MSIMRSQSDPCILSDEQYERRMSEKSNVSFSTIEFNEHAYILGPNSSPSGGPWLEIDWESQASLTIDLDDYEASRYERRTKAAMHMPGDYRTQLLLGSGYTMSEINGMTSEKPSKASSSPRRFSLKRLSKVLPKRPSI